MEGLLTRQYTGIAGFEGRQLQGVLIGFGARVNQEQLVIVVTTDLTQSLCQLHLQLINYRVGVEADLTELFGYLLQIVGVRVSDADHSMSAIEVKIFLTFVIPYLATLALYDVYVEERIYVE